MTEVGGVDGGGGEELNGLMKRLKLSEEERCRVKWKLSMGWELSRAGATSCGEAVLRKARVCGWYGAGIGENLVPKEWNQM